MRILFALVPSMENRLISICLGMCLISIAACSRATSVYSDPSPAALSSPYSTDPGANLPKDFYAQSVNQASVGLQPDGVTGTSKAIRFQTSTSTNAVGGFNGSGLGSRAILGLGSWNKRPVGQADPITFDAQVFNGTESIGVNLQIDLNCDGTTVHVVNASGSDIASQATVSAGDGYTRFTASQTAAIWISPTSAILDSSTATILVPSSGAPVALTALLAKYPAACLKTISTSAIDLPRGIPTAAILWSLGTDATTSNNSTFVRRFTVGSELFEGLE